MQIDKTEEKLKENLANAEFALLMYKAAQAEGEQLLLENERLKREDDLNVPIELERVAQSTISKAFAKKAAKRNVKEIGNVLSKVAVVVLVFNVLFLTLFGTASAFRANVLNFMYETFDIATSVSMNGASGETSTGAKLTSLGWLPVGYELSSMSDWGTDGFVSEYANAEGLRVGFSCFTGNASMNVDTENAEIVKDVVINGYTGLYVKKETRQTVVWGDTENNYLYLIEADAVSELDFQKIIDNME